MSQKDNQATSESWEDRFEKNFCDNKGNWKGCWEEVDVYASNVKDFIRELLQSEKDKLKGEKPHETADDYCCACGYDIACFESKLQAQKDRLKWKIETLYHHGDVRTKLILKAVLKLFE